MKIEDQVCSLELAKKLKKLGVKQESLFYWVKHWKGRYEGHVNELFYGKDEDDNVNPHISAFTVAELGEMLPAEVNCPSYFTVKRQNREGTNYHSLKVGGKENMATGERHAFTFLLGNYDKNEANVRAEMVAYLAEKRCGSCESLNPQLKERNYIYTCKHKDSKEYRERIERRFLACKEFKEKPDNKFSPV